MPTCTVPMHPDVFMCMRHKVKSHKDAAVLSYPGIRPSVYPHIHGFTMTEMVVVIVMVSLFAFLVQVNLFGLLRKNTFKAQVQDLLSTMQMAANAAAESNRRYELIIDPIEQNYVLREVTSPDLSQVLQEEIIVENDLSDNCRVVYIEFDDGESVNDGWAKFRVGHSGWQYGGKIVLIDKKDQPYSIVVNRLNKAVSLIKGDVELLEPKAKEEVPF
jgi:prepilin-type N-terminal cleavage/methylation domain-containing protein